MSPQQTHSSMQQVKYSAVNKAIFVEETPADLSNWSFNLWS